MEKQEYFKQALSKFAFHAASGGAIRHLADHGYTAKQIVQMLDFPTPFERVQREVWEYFLEKGTISLEEPTPGLHREKAEYVVEYNAYGKKSFRKVIAEEGHRQAVQWQTDTFSELRYGNFKEFLERKCLENGETQSYVSCDFGLRQGPSLEGLDPAEQEYISGLFCERRRVYHQLDQRMRAIICELQSRGAYKGSCYFIKTGEKINIG